MMCPTCNGTGRISEFVVQKSDGRRFRVSDTRLCPVCDAPLMLGDPRRGLWHCSRVEDGPSFMSHFERSIYRELLAEGTR